MPTTFEVSPEVTPRGGPLPAVTLVDSLRAQSAPDVEACGANVGSLVASEPHPFVGAVHHAFAEHLPLVLSPDDVWLVMRHHQTGRCDVPNRFAFHRSVGRSHANGPCTSDLPSGLSRVPFIWEYFHINYPMEFLAGFVGVSQAPDSHAVRPAIGWAVRQTAEPSGEGFTA